MADLWIFFIVVIVVVATAAALHIFFLLFVWRQYWQFKSLFFLWMYTFPEHLKCKHLTLKRLFCCFVQPISMLCRGISNALPNVCPVFNCIVVLCWCCASAQSRSHEHSFFLVYRIVNEWCYNLFNCPLSIELVVKVTFVSNLTSPKGSQQLNPVILPPVHTTASIQAIPPFGSITLSFFLSSDYIFAQASTPLISFTTIVHELLYFDIFSMVKFK